MAFFIVSALGFRAWMGLLSKQHWKESVMNWKRGTGRLFHYGNKKHANMYRKWIIGRTHSLRCRAWTKQYSGIIISMNSSATLSRFESQLHCSLSVSPWISCLTSLSLTFLTYEIIFLIWLHYRAFVSTELTAESTKQCAAYIKCYTNIFSYFTINLDNKNHF